ncbi:hypothetical protein MNBD_BACTEROID03-708 [hydrothermal vent metagenome]|uniref:Uncharacterized protein n=1 Tax=hydrothermal vent metagenome TaxID=652676 RepID=A0A3B0TLY1_9ZZZZ
MRFVPQGWAFFTRSPREAQVILYEFHDDDSLIKYPQKHSSYKNIFGLDRKISKVLTEIQALKFQIPDTLYTNYQWNYQTTEHSKLKRPLNVCKVKNGIYQPILCGDYLLVFQKPIPWAWSKSINKLKMPAKIIHLRIECNDTE